MMHKKIPRTSSTQLSGAAWKTEIWPKKRPPMLFLSLMCAMCLLCGNLASCQTRSAEEPDISDRSQQEDASSAQLEQPPVLEPEPVPNYIPEGLTFSEGWENSVNLDGLDTEYLYWRPLDDLFFSDPVFLGSYFESKSISGRAAWIDDGKTAMRVSWDGEGHPYGSFTVYMGSGRVERNGVTGELSDEELITVVQTFAQLMEKAEEYKKELDSRPPEEGPLPLDRPIEMTFSSGAGGWWTVIRLHADGSFQGDYCDADMNTEYVCQFHGTFRDITQVTDTSWSMTLDELVLDTEYPVGTEWDEGSYHYVSSEPYGFDDKDYKALIPGAPFMFYSPEAKGYAPTDDLYGMNGDDFESALYEFWTWWPDKHGWGPYGDTLGCYGLHNITSGRGFFS